MTPHEQIQAWLDDDARTFSAGYDLFVAYGRNRALMLYLARKMHMEKLVYELQKLLQVPLKADAVKVVPQIVRAMSSEAASAKELRKITAQLDETFAIETNQLKRINPKTLPEAQCKIYDEIAEAYKLQRVWHEKMKLAETDEDRAAARAEVERLDDLICEGWNGLDAFAKSGEKVPAVAKVATVLEISKEINACRSYISRSINEMGKLDGEKKLKRTSEVQVRIARLITLQAPVKKETRKALFSLGIITDASELVGE